MFTRFAFLRVLSLVLLFSASVQANQVNVYSARSEALIKPLLNAFTEDTGIKVNLVTGKADLLLTRMAREGKYGKADLLITTDVGRLHRAKSMGLLQSMDINSVTEMVSKRFIDSDGHWIALTTRARPMMYLADKTDVSQLSSLFDLAKPEWKGRVCIRSSSNIYNQSMVAAMIEQYGEAKVLEWASRFVKNFARSPQGGDRDQIKALVAGECDIAVANTYYLAGMAVDADKATSDIAKQVSVLWPDQSGDGAHINISGAAISRYARNKENAQALIEYMLTKKAQQWYAQDNQEYPIVGDVPWSPALMSYGDFKAQKIALETVGERNAQAVKLMDKAGWK